jgi:2-phosphosulfolactate phosphatase
MHIEHATLETCANVTGCAVVIDVWRSFTTTAFAFAAGAREIRIAASQEEALQWRQNTPDAILIGMGKLGGPTADGFDYGNSPVEVSQGNFGDHRLILCTPNGTRGLVRCADAQILLAGSFVCAEATLLYIKQQMPKRVTFICTEPGPADRSYAEYMVARLQGENPDAAVILAAVRTAGLQHARTLIAQGKLTEGQAAKLAADLDCCLELDRFDFAMPVQRHPGILVMETR